jgi:hypothetical protein
MAGDVTTLAFMVERLPLINYRGTNANDQKHSQDRTVALVRKWQSLNQELRAARRDTLACCEARPGKGDSASLAIIDRAEFDRLQETIAGHMEQIGNLEQAIVKLDALITENGIAPGYLAGVQQRISGAKSSIYRQQKAISDWSAFYTKQNPRMSPEDVLRLPEFKSKRATAQKIIDADKAFVEKIKPVVDEIERVLESVGC